MKRQQPPWRVIRGFPSPSGETLAHVHNISGGVFDTDALACRFEVAAGAQAQVTTTGATRIYRSRSDHNTATQCTEITLGTRAYFEYLPDQIIPFAGSRFRQKVRLELDEMASLIWWERFAPGREASGEVFQYETLASTLEIVAAGERVATEKWTLAPLIRKLDSPARLGPFLHFASCYICRAGEPAAFWRNFESQLQCSAEKESSAGILWGVTCLQAHGLVVRGASTSGRLLRESWIEVWRAAKWLLCGRAAALPRKVH